MSLSSLYLPVVLMLVGLILRGVAFDFRVKARDAHRPLWNRAFYRVFHGKARPLYYG